MSAKRVLFADDNEDLCEVFKEGLEKRGFDVVCTSTVNEALKYISETKFDVLISDLHIPEAGDGFVVVSAMRHANPNAVTLVLSGYPEIEHGMKNILNQVDEILLKPMSLTEVIKVIEKKLSRAKTPVAPAKERVAAILERNSNLTILDWLSNVATDPELVRIDLLPEARAGHLPLILADLVNRLRIGPQPKASLSIAATEHGILRRKQGYTMAMMVEESRILQVCIFKTLQNNLVTVDFDTVLLDVMTIADEVDLQLKQAVMGFLDAPVSRSVTNLN